MNAPAANHPASGHQPVRTVCFLLVPGFALSSFSLAVETLSVVNTLCGYTAYDYHLYSAAEDPSVTRVLSSNNVPVQTQAWLSEARVPDLAVVCSYKGAASCDNNALFAKLRRFRHAGAQLAALSSASFILARAGLLNNQSCTLFNEDIPTFRELYPRIGIQDNIYTVNGNIFTCAGGMTTLDMMLYIVGMDLGVDCVNRVAHQFCHNQIRSAEEMQNSRRYLELRMKSPCLGAAVEVMESNIEEPYSIQLLADRIGTTPRSLEQAFRKHAQTTPVQYYLQLRLSHARKLIEQTALPFSTIAQASGFSSQSYFTKRFKELYEISPRQLRNLKKS